MSYRLHLPLANCELRSACILVAMRHTVVFIWITYRDTDHILMQGVNEALINQVWVEQGKTENIQCAGSPGVELRAIGTR